MAATFMMLIGSSKMDKRLQKFSTFEEFWPYYLRQHSKSETRLLHFVGYFLAACSILKGVFSLKLGWILVAPVISYTCAWFSHLFLQSNRSSTFEYPMWSLRGDFQMLKLWLNGQLHKVLPIKEIQITHFCKGVCIS